MLDQDFVASNKDSEQIHGKVTLIGKELKNKMQKTVVVVVERKVRDKKYKKYQVRSTKLYVHDEENKCKPGDMVMVRLTRPISKLKNWQLVKIIEQ